MSAKKELVRELARSYNLAESKAVDTLFELEIRKLQDQIYILRCHVHLEFDADNFGRFTDLKVRALNDKKRYDVIALIVLLELQSDRWKSGSFWVYGYVVPPELLGMKRRKGVREDLSDFSGLPDRAINLN